MIWTNGQRSLVEKEEKKREYMQKHKTFKGKVYAF